MECLLLFQLLHPPAVVELLVEHQLVMQEAPVVPEGVVLQEVRVVVELQEMEMIQQQLPLKVVIVEYLITNQVYINLVVVVAEQLV
tara:strand:- start:248 stop:505 length:258 start_codon:yes stop_codon:yes gene_type:complete